MNNKDNKSNKKKQNTNVNFNPSKNFFIKNYNTVKSVTTNENSKKTEVDNRAIKSEHNKKQTIKKVTFNAFEKNATAPNAQAQSQDSPLTKRHIAALYLIVIGLEKALEVVKHFSVTERDEIIKIIRTITSISPRDLSQVEKGFGKLPKIDLTSFVNGDDYANRLTLGMLQRPGQKTYFIKEEKPFVPPSVTQQQTPPAPAKEETQFDFMEKLKPAQSFELLKDESDMVISLALSVMDKKSRAEILKSFPPRRMINLAKMMSQKKEVSPEIVTTVATKLKEQAERFKEDENTIKIGGRDKLIEILKLTNLDNAKNLVHDLESSMPEVAQEIKDRLFTFEDLPTVPRRQMQEILMNYEYKEIAFMLKGAPDNIKEYIYSCVTKKKKELIEEEIAFLGPVKKRDVLEKRRTFLVYLQDLEMRGDIILRSDDMI